MEQVELKRFWEQIKEDLIASLPANVHPWISPLEISGYDNGVLTVVTGQAMGRDIIRKNYLNEINEIIKKHTGEEGSRLNLIYDTGAAKILKKEAEKLQKKLSEKELKEQAIQNLSNMQSYTNLNLKYKFENFVVGANSKFAYESALMTAKNPSTKFNPLFIYGNSGLGKTHLMQAIGHYILFNNSKLTVKYTKTDDYINDFISSSRKSNDSVENMSKFNKKYTNIDVILIDDIQFLESKGKTMERMQHTFDSLYNKGKQIVITCDRLPKDIPTITSALCSRFEMGLMVELTPPDFETRAAILKKIAEDNGITCEDDAIKYIAEHFSNNVRELEGAFTKVCAYAEMQSENVTLKLSKEILKCEDKKNELNYGNIIDTVAKYYEILPTEIMGSSRNQKIAIARHLSMYLCRELLNESFENIAKYYDKRHTTILFGYEKVKSVLATNNDIKVAIREIKQALQVI